MPTPRTATQPARTIRLIYAALVSGVCLFALVSHFALRPAMGGSTQLPSTLVPALLGVALAACALSLLLRRRIPRRSTDESADLFWSGAVTPALITWAAVEGAGLLSVLLYALTGAQSAIAVAAVAIILFLSLNPTFLERR